MKSINIDESDQKLGIKPFDYDEDLLSIVKDSSIPVLRVYPFPETAIVLGRGSKAELELEIENSHEDKVALYRRRGGGCSVVLDSGNLVVSVVFPVEGLGETKYWFDRSTKWLIKGLKDSGFKDVYWDGISDLVIGNRKIAGSSFYRTKGLAYYTVSLLVTPELELMGQYLKHPPREPDYRKNRPHSDFVMSLNEVDKSITVPELAKRLEQNLKIEELMDKRVEL